MTGKELIRQLKKQGWVVGRVNGSHYIMKKGSNSVSVPYHTTDLATGICNAILKQAGLK